jgi:hypothetical protein
MAVLGASGVLRLIASDPWRLDVLRTVRDLELPDCWVGAGFVRALVWDHLHGYDDPTPLDDVDVIYFDDDNTDKAEDRLYEERLADVLAQVPWSVKNQARMHRRNGDKPYRDTSDALCHWLETPTAVAVRMDDDEQLELLAPLGLDDLLAMRIVPTPHALNQRLSAYRERVLAKPWARQWPRVDIKIPD